MPAFPQVLGEWESGTLGATLRVRPARPAAPTDQRRPGALRLEPRAAAARRRALLAVRGLGPHPIIRRVEPAEAELYQRATGGDAAALELLLERYMPQLHAFVRLRLDAVVRARESSMDVVQSVCRELLAAKGAFEFQGEDRFRAWLFTSALNKILEKQRFHRLAKRDLGRELPATAGAEAAEVAAASLLTPSLHAIGRETAQKLEDALDALSPEHREVITLARVVRLPHRVIAEVMERSEEAVRQLLARAVLRLTLELRERGVELSA
jgi:RNA polymerase sigma factor (sigma-70 family)